MPHVIVKLWQGRTDEQKKELSDEIAKAVVGKLDVNLDDVSVAFEEVDPEDWRRKVYDKDILEKWDGLYKKPGY